MLDGITFEKLGRPTVSVIGDEFRKLALMKRDSVGMTAFQPVFFPFSASTWASSEEQIAQTADLLFDRIVEVLCSAPCSASHAPA